MMILRELMFVVINYVVSYNWMADWLDQTIRLSSLGNMSCNMYLDSGLKSLIILLVSITFYLIDY